MREFAGDVRLGRKEGTVDLRTKPCSGHRPPSTSMCSRAQKLCDSNCPCVFTELNLQPPSPLHSSGLGLKVLGPSGDQSHPEAI